MTSSEETPERATPTPGGAFRRVFWDIMADAGGPVGHDIPVSDGGPMEQSRVAVVIEDEEDIRSLLGTVLEQAGFEVHGAGNGTDGLALVQQHNPIVTTLDVNMPGMDGFETAKRIRAISSTYLVMLTARSEEIDALQGLESGADDYVTKPFRPRELRARIDAMMRRPRTPATATAPASAPAAAPVSTTRGDDAGWLTHRGLEVNAQMRIVRADGHDVELTRSEFDILAAVVEAGGRVVGKTDLALTLRGEPFGSAVFVSDSDARAIEVHMANLRRKLGDAPSTPRWIETVRGVGYRLTAR